MRWRTISTCAAVGLVLLLFQPRTADAQQQPGQPQSGRVTGRIMDGTGRPLAGAQVYIPGTGIGSVTDGDGRFLLQNVPAGQARVMAELVGYRRAETATTVTAGQTATANLTLNETAILLEQVVVTGAGVATQRKKLGNTIAAIDASKVTTAAVSDVSQMLAAREPGVQVLPSGGYTGEGARIRIRGSSSLSQLNEPVIYVDGIRMDRNAVDFAPQGNPSKLDDIPPESIERIEILKGAAAATLYGTEASNGVIQIFTKKGRSGAPRFTLQIDQTAITMPTNRILPLADFAESEADIERIRRRWGREVQLFEPFQYDPFPDYFNTGHQQAYSLSVHGGTDLINYFVTGRLLNENGPVAFGDLFPDREGFEETDDKQSRAQMAANVVLTPVDKVRVGVNTMYAELQQGVPNAGNNIYGAFPNLTQSFLRLACDSVVENLCPTVNRYGTNNFMTANEAVYQLLDVETNHFVGSSNVNYTPIPSLKLDATFGVDFSNEAHVFFRPFGWNIDKYATVTTQGTREATDVRTRVLTADFKTAWEGALSGDFSNRLLLGAQGFMSERTERESTGTRFPGPGLEVTEAGSEQTVEESWTRNTQIGGYVDNQLGFREWAFATVGARWDANSAFGEEFSTAFYPKVNASFVPTEAFGWTGNIFSTIRLRAAIGKSGLQPSSFAKFTTFSAQPSADGPGLRPDNLGNDKLKPEVATEIETGAELGLFDDRASINFTYWTTDVNDALVARQFPVAGGFINRQLDNIGLLHKHGVDLAVNGTVLRQRNLSINLSLNGAYLYQEIKDLGGAPSLKTGASYPRYRQYLTEGFAPGSFFAAKVANVDIPLNIVAKNTDGSCREPTREEALAFFATPRNPSGPGGFKPLLVGNSGLGKATGALAGVSPDCGMGPLNTYIGKSTPDWQGTFGVTIGFLGNFELNSLMEFKAGNFVYHDLSGEFRRSSPTIGRNVPKCASLEATMRNPDSSAPSRLDAAVDWARSCEGLTPVDGLNSIKPADFIRWREFTLTYRVPTSFIDRWGLASAQFSVGARNLALWVNDQFTGMDPELTLNGRCNGGDDTAGLDCNFLDATDGWQVPIPRRITFSTRVSF